MRLKFISFSLVIVSLMSLGHPATVDMGFTLGKVFSGGQPLAGTAVRLGFFSSYNDTLGTSFFTGKDYNSLFSSFTPLDLVVTPGNFDTLGTGPDAGTIYSSFSTSDSSNYSNVGSNTRLFAWFWNSPSPSVSAAWAVVSGTIGGTTDFDSAWLAPAPDALSATPIEVGVISNQIFAESALANALEPFTGFDPLGANLVLIPEPSTMSLVIIGLTTVLAFRRKRA